jgi:phage shock protein A
MDDDYREAKSLVGKVEAQVGKGDPAWAKQGLEDAPEIADKLAEFKEKYQGFAKWSEIETELTSRLTAAIKGCKGKIVRIASTRFIVFVARMQVKPPDDPCPSSSLPLPFCRTQAEREMDDDYREAKSLVGKVEEQVGKGNPAWAKQGLEDAPEIADKLAEFKEKYEGFAKWSEIETELTSRLTAAIKGCKGKIVRAAF